MARKSSKILDVIKNEEVPKEMRDAFEEIFESLKDIENRLQNIEIRMTLISKKIEN